MRDIVAKIDVLLMGQHFVTLESLPFPYLNDDMVTLLIGGDAFAFTDRALKFADLDVEWFIHGLRPIHPEQIVMPYHPLAFGPHGAAFLQRIAFAADGIAFNALG